MKLLSVVYSLLAYWFWSWVVFTGGGKHDSYNYARWRQYVHKEYYLSFIKQGL